MAQTWRNLLFAHWPLSPRVLRPLIPAGLTLESFESQAWVGITPFVITGLRPRAMPALPGVSQFPEINVRTYVTAGGKPGVFFFSLDAGSALAVAAARALYSLPYFRARITVRAAARGGITYSSRRTHRGAPRAEFSAEYRPTGDAALARAGTLDHWLTERYCLYAVDGRGGLHRAEIHHPPWPLQPAEAEIRRNTMTEGPGFELPDVAPLLHFARRLDVQVWPPERVRASSTRRVPARSGTALPEQTSASV
jgi:uncharacterized protein YqjF (DUF2071 family)